MKKIILVLGMHRSGTSMVTQLCQYMGAYLGEENELIVAAETNPDGHFENKEISRIDNDILHYCGREWYSLEGFESYYSSAQIKKAEGQLKLIVQKLLEKSNIVAIKDPRISILLPVWKKILSGLDVEVQYIWVYRNPLEVAESLRKRDGYSRKHGLLLWSYYNLNILKYLKGRDYLLLHYKDIVEDFQKLEDLSRLFGKKIDDDLKLDLERLIKRKYRHSHYSYQDIRDIQNGLLSNLYGALLENQESELDILDLEREYIEESTKKEIRYIDYDVLKNIHCMKQKELIIYGAGNYGTWAADMLQQLGFQQFDFCDKDISKHGTILKGGKVFSIKELEEKKNLCVIIAIKDDELRKEAEETLRCIEGVSFLSFIVLRMVWKYSAHNTSLAAKVETFSAWYKELAVRGDLIRDACNASVLVYQNGKVGSSTVAQSLQSAGIKSAHIHRFFFKNDIVGELLLGEEQQDFIKKSNIFQFQSLKYVKSIKDEIKRKKIITMVRDPIAVDLSTVFQWIGTEISDRYFAEQLKKGKAFQQIVAEFMVKMQNRLFDWFDEELKELCGVDVFAYPFDKDKGYATILHNDVEILLIKAEKLSQMAEVLKHFTGNNQVELVNKNMGKDKGYAHIYDAIKKRLVLPKEYVEFYYKNNPYMDHFYSEEEKKEFLKKWSKCIKEKV